MNILKWLFQHDENYQPKYVVENKPSGPKRTYRGKNRGIGWTRKSHEESKARRKMAAKSRRINRK